MLLGVMLNENLKVAVENACIQKQLLEGRILTNFTEVWILPKKLSFNNNHVIVNPLLSSPHTFGGSP